jgi:hypothetical protein
MGNEHLQHKRLDERLKEQITKAQATALPKDAVPLQWFACLPAAKAVSLSYRAPYGCFFLTPLLYMVRQHLDIFKRSEY